MTTLPRPLLALWVSHITSGAELGEQHQSGLRHPCPGSAPKAQNPRTSLNRSQLRAQSPVSPRHGLSTREQGSAHRSLASKLRSLESPLSPPSSSPCAFHPSTVSHFLLLGGVCLFAMAANRESQMLKVWMVPPSIVTGPQARPLSHTPSLKPAGPRGGATSTDGDRPSPGGTCFWCSLQRLKSSVTRMSNLETGISNSNSTGRKGGIFQV